MACTYMYCIYGLDHEVLGTRKVQSTPATTNVAAWITADTAVGPSIASGSQAWRPSTTILVPSIRATHPSEGVAIIAVVRCGHGMALGPSTHLRMAVV